MHEEDPYNCIQQKEEDDVTICSLSIGFLPTDNVDFVLERELYVGKGIRSNDKLLLVGLNL